MFNSGNAEDEMERAYGKPNTSHKIGNCDEIASSSPEKQL
jgi:hypothetical protein